MNVKRRKERKRRIFAVICITACVLTGISNDNAYAAAKFRVAKAKVTLYEGTKKNVKYAAPSKVRVITSNKRVVKASVSGKKIVIKGIKKGSAKVTVKYRKKQISIKVTVKSAKQAKPLKPEIKMTNSPAPTAVVTIAPKEQPTAVPTLKPEEVVLYAKALTPYSDGENRFSCEMFNRMKKANENIFISPYSLYTALSMLSNGASGNTQSQLLTALGTTDLAGLNNTTEGYLGGSMDERVAINTANSLWLSGRMPLAPDIDARFISPLQKYYKADIFRNIDFGNAAIVNDVNNWISDKTNGLIKHTVDEFSPNTVMALVNTLFFKGRWSSVFSKNLTASEMFHGSLGDTQVQMMNRHNTWYNYYSDSVFRGICMKYGRYDRYEMDILMSADETRNTGEVWNQLTVEEQMAAFKKFSNNENSDGYVKIRNLKMPKFDLEYDAGQIKPIEALQGLGVTDMFGINASFDGIAPEICVNSIIHKTVLKVEEEGAEAAAVTAVKGLPTAAAPTPEVPSEIDYIIDRPFVFCIRDNVSGMILFIGEVNNM